MKTMNNKIFLNHWTLKPSQSSQIIIPDNISFPKKGIKAKSPGDVYLDLLDAGLIPDPFYAENELRLQWVTQCNWEYETSFDIEKDDLFKALVFDGLDTFADIYLNNTLIGHSENMFVQYKFDVKQKLVQGKNHLKIIFNSSLQKAIELKTDIKQLPSARHPNRAFTRKAQYSFGWDWGPAFPSMGIWKDAYLQNDNIEINNLAFETVSIKNTTANVRISFEYTNPLNQQIGFKVLFKKGDYTFTGSIKAEESDKISLNFDVENAQLWWPHDIGTPNLYKLKIIAVGSDGNNITQLKKDVGIRTVKLKLRENGINCFKFLINNQPLFLKGANWIPADSFLPRIDKNKYSTLIESARDANMNVLRIWGGGIYEDDYFYELCDQLGILVWQDFMFACATYPDHNGFLENVKTEVVQNVNRLNYHPSILIWCGNNEIEWIWYRDNCGALKDMQGFKLFHKEIPVWLKTLDNTSPYWPSSPFGDEEDPNSELSGNTHSWDIWSQWVDYTDVKHDESLFVTEFGFQAPANIDTLNKVIPKKDRWIQSKVFEHHNKQDEGPERLIKFLANHLPVNTNWQDYIYLTQLNQGFALKTCLEHWRTNNRTNGSIIWQLNDCWPVASWSLIDSELIPKLSYYFVKNVFSRQLIYFSNKSGEINLYIQNQSNDNFEGSYKILFIDTLSGSVKEKFNNNVDLNETITKNIESFLNVSTVDDNTIILARLYNHTGELINSNVYNNLPWKHYKLAKAKIILKKKGKKQIILSSNKPAYFVDLYAKGVQFSDRGFSILPGEKIKIDIIGEKRNKIKEDDISIYSLNKYLK